MKSASIKKTLYGIRNIVEVNGALYGVALNCDSLIQFDMSGTAKEIIKLPIADRLNNYNIFVYKRYIYIVDYNDGSVIICSKSATRKCNNEKKYFCSGAHLWNDEIIIFPRHIDGNIIVFDIKKESFNYMAPVSELVNKSCKAGVIRRTEIFDGAVYLLNTDEKEIYSFDLNKKKVERFETIVQGEIYDMAKLGEKYYFILRNNGRRIYEYDRGKTTVREINTKGEGNYDKLFIVENKIYIFSDTKEHVVDIYDGEKIHTINKKGVQGTIKHCGCFILDNGKKVLLPWMSRKAIILDGNDFMLDTKNFYINEEVGKKVVYEGEYSLPEWLNVI